MWFDCQKLRLQSPRVLRTSAFEMPPAEMIDLYRTADAFVMTSVLEGFSSALLEAMAAALPVIVTDAPGCADFVREEDSGWIVPPRDASRLGRKYGRHSSEPASQDRAWRIARIEGPPNSIGRWLWTDTWNSMASL